MSKEMVISASPHETRVAILEEGQLCEYYVEREKEFALVGSIYKGRVTRVLPGMQSAFVDIGLDSDAFLYVSDFLEDIEEFDQIVTTVEDKVQKMEDQGGQVFAAADASAPAVEPADVEPGEAHAEPAASNTDGEAADAEGPSPGNSIADAPPAGIPAVHSQPSQPRYNAPRYERPRFDSRGRDRRDFGQGGQGGRGGRGGRHGHGSGRGRGGNRRFGRDLPQSKYAAPRYEDRSESAPPSDYTPIILPGESLAKYRDRAPSASPASHAEEHGFASPSAPATSFHEEHHGTESVQHHGDYTSSSFGLGPLPGETLSKYQPNEPSAAIHPIELERVAEENHVDPEEPELPPAKPSERESDELDSVAAFREPHHDPEAVHDADISGLSDEQAVTLAAHVAEAQIEKITDADEPADEVAEGADEDEEEDSHLEGSEVADEELEEEEAEAEAEGMIAHSESDFEANSETAADRAHEDAILPRQSVRAVPCRSPKRRCRKKTSHGRLACATISVLACIIPPAVEDATAAAAMIATEDAGRTTVTATDIIASSNAGHS